MAPPSDVYRKVAGLELGARWVDHHTSHIYGTPSMNIHALQASILDNIKDITDFTIQTDIEMDSSSLMVAIRLLVKCDTAVKI